MTEGALKKTPLYDEHVRLGADQHRGQADADPRPPQLRQGDGGTPAGRVIKKHGGAASSGSQPGDY